MLRRPQNCGSVGDEGKRREFRDSCIVKNEVDIGYPKIKKSVMGNC